MTTDEKLQELLDTTMANARKQANEIIKGYNASADRILEDYRQSKREYIESRISAECSALKTAENKEVSATQIVIRKELSYKQEELKGKLFSEIVVLLDNYKKTEEYEKLLVSQIREEKNFAGENPLTVYIDPADAEKKDRLEKETGCVLTVSAYSFIGGTRAVTNDNKILIDNSFQTALEEERDKFILQGGRTNE
ncbi:MAG TPA: hypothetical protein PLU43_00455 [Lachnospiraceae bacterium]|nr:hypothetical protein [Lachnospiraceae bacterium]